MFPEIGQASSGVTNTLGSATVNVLSAARRQRATMLVLDCSATMHQPHPVESATNPLTTSRRHLVWIQLDWRSCKSWSIGAVQRITWVSCCMVIALRWAQRSTASCFKPSMESSNPFPSEIEAYEDIETILSPGKFGDQEFADVAKRLELIVPWGQTPLYLAVMTAAQELQLCNVNADAKTHEDRELNVIVVSDGRNYQFNPTADKNISLEQVIRVAQQAGVRVHIIGFGIANNELEQATREFTQLAEQTGGSVCMDVQSARQLVSRIDAMTEPIPIVSVCPVELG